MVGGLIGTRGTQRISPGAGSPDRLLIVTSDFPPLTGTNTQRVQSFVRHLPALGWKCTVLTQALADLDVIASADLGGVDARVEVLRVESPDPFLARRRAGGWQPRDVSTAAAQTERAAKSIAVGTRKRSFTPTKLAARVLRAWLRRYVYVPDALMPWAGKAADTAVAQVRTGRYRALLTSAPSFSGLVAGLRVKQRTGIPWVADFRDLWVGRPYRQVTPRLASADRRLEAAVVDAADAVVLASPPWREVFLERYGARIESKLHVITNGFEIQGPWPPQTAQRTDGEVLFVYTGSMHPAESPEPFLRALIGLSKLRPDLIGRIQARFIGTGDEVPRLSELIAGTPLSGRVQFLGARPHSECVAAQAEADVLLLFSASQHVDTIRGKSFEYMASGKTILAAVPPHGIQAALLRDAGTALVLDYEDVPGLEQAVLRLLTEPGARAMQPDWAYIGQFDRKHLAGKLAKILLELPVWGQEGARSG